MRHHIPLAPGFRTRDWHRLIACDLRRSPGRSPRQVPMPRPPSLPTALDALDRAFASEEPFPVTGCLYC